MERLYASDGNSTGRHLDLRHFFLLASFGLALIAWEQHAGLAILPVAFGLFIAARLIRNACRRNSPRAKDEEF
jgi:hypothetical protein